MYNKLNVKDATAVVLRWCPDPVNNYSVVDIETLRKTVPSVSKNNYGCKTIGRKYLAPNSDVCI